MTQPLVSIVIPTYDRAHLLPQAIDSVLAQDYPNVELIVVDDGSTDGTRELLERYAAELSGDRFQWHALSHGGQGRAVNHGLAQTRGEILGTLASDDLLEGDAVRRLVAELERPGPVMAHGQNRLIDEDGREIDFYDPPPYTLQGSVVACQSPIGAGALFRRTVYESIGGWNPDNRYFPDLEYWGRASLVGDFAFVPHIVGAMRVHAGSITHGERGFEMARQRIVQLDRLFADPQLGPQIASVRTAAYRNAFILAAMDIAPEEVNQPGERFFLEDTHAAQNSRLAAHRHESELLGYRASIAQAEHTLAEQDAVIRQLQAVIHQLQDAVADRDQRLRECYAALYPPQ